MVRFAIVIVMLYAVLLTIIVIFLELGLWLPASGYKRIWPALTFASLVPVSLLMAINYWNWFTILFLIIAGYRAVNLWRYILRRRQIDHLYAVVKRASCWLLVAQLITLILVITTTPKSLQFGLNFISAIALVGCLILVWSTQHNLRRTRPITTEAGNTDYFPTLSVLIPARNETDDLTECLQSLVKSTYPKLEIIVLDDRSQNKRTPEIIKNFAQDGVRFIAGSIAPTNWLAKNYAYQQLTVASSGELMLFCGADTRFKPETLTTMVSELIIKRKTMISFIPANDAPGFTKFASLFIQPSRYAWELALPRRPLERPPVLSTAWLISRNTLLASGGFKSAAHAATPERVLARYAASHDDGYSFLQSDTEHGVVSVKSFQEQRATAIRTRYPQLHQSLELTALTSLLELLILVGPFVIAVMSLLQQRWLLLSLTAVICILLVGMYAQITNLTYRRFIFRSLWLLPLVTIYDVLLLNYSLYKYEFSEVIWKGRNVCVPVMQIIDRLP